MSSLTEFAESLRLKITPESYAKISNNKLGMILVQKNVFYMPENDYVAHDKFVDAGMFENSFLGIDITEKGEEWLIKSLLAAEIIAYRRELDWTITDYKWLLETQFTDELYVMEYSGAENVWFPFFTESTKAWTLKNIINKNYPIRYREIVR
jgi:hypothetical protein